MTPPPIFRVDIHIKALETKRASKFLENWVSLKAVGLVKIATELLVTNCQWFCQTEYFSIFVAS